MKKYVVFAALCTAIACNSADNKGGEQKPADSSGNTTNAVTPTADEAGLEMIGALDCTTCHKMDEKNIGPGYKEVAQKYESNDENINKLAKKIIDGGSGVWGSVPMTPHPSLSMDSAKVMVKYILSLKNK